MKTLIFDFDGTIADSFETLLGVFQRPLKQIFRYWPWQTPRLARRAKHKIGQQIDDVKPFDGLSQVLKQLHKDGHQMFILSTNDPATITDFLSANKLDDCFDGVHGNIGLGGKARSLRSLIKAQKIDKSTAVYIGDEVRDIEAAKKAGITPVSVGWGFNYPEALQKANPSAIALKPTELIKILS